MGYIRAGVAGLLVAGVCFIVPALALVLAISVAYVAYGTLPAVGALLAGIQPIILAIILHATYRLGRVACQRPAMMVLAVVAYVLALLLPFDAVWVIIVGGVVGVAMHLGMSSAQRLGIWLPFFGMPNWSFSTAATEIVVAPLWQLTLFFLKVGVTLMGSGYVLISYLEYDVVYRHGWLTYQQLLDAVAVGQMTPGPVFSTAAFVGYVNQAGTTGDIGAGLIGGIAIFLPSFVIVFLLAPWIPRLREAPLAGAFLDGVNAAVVGSIAATTWTLLLITLLTPVTPIWLLSVGALSVDGAALLMLVGALAILLRFSLNSTILIVAGALIGLMVHILSML